MDAPNDILERNLRALARASQACAKLIETTPARRDLDFTETDDGALSAAIGIGPAARALASRRRPLAEAERLAATVDINDCGGVVVLGFGVGHHVASVARRMGRRGVVIVYESDLSLLRSVLERIDHSGWIEKSNLVVISNCDDAGTMAGAVRGVEGILALGVKVLEHPPSRPRLGREAERFTATLTQMISAMRATLVTTLVQVETTMRNELMNIDHYATVGGVGELAGIGAGRPAVVIAAGPSLERNIALLEDPDLRRRVVIIAVQTMLKPLLARGIRPHFVTALDYHEISRRFYEGLTAEDVEGVTLVAEAKANPAILDAFPGVIRCARDAFLDQVLGGELMRPMGSLEPGATVAHLAYYLARHLGCDPVILTGQDLGFTDGQYYASGAAIHQIWAAELNEFNTLEMMEWQRIVRARRSLSKLTDIHGRTIYTDEQMNSYLVQFERDFASDSARGLRILDASEGGVRKKSTEVCSLVDALAATVDVGELETPPAPDIDRRERLPAVERRITGLRGDVANVAKDSRRAKRLLEKMQSADRERINRLIDEVHAVDVKVKARQPAFDMVQQLNQTGVLNRFKADRAIELDEGLSAADRQKQQIERDITNVSWLADAADQLGSLLEDAQRAVSGGRKLTHDPTSAPRARGQGRSRVAAMITVDPNRDALGRARPLEDELHRTLRRLSRCSRLKHAILVTQEPERVRALAGEVEGLTVDVVGTAHHPMAGRDRAIRGARAWADSCWRGGLSSMTCYDEVLAPTPMSRAMREHNIDAGVLVGADWTLVDPAIIDSVVERHLQRPQKHRIVFTQAPPGFGGCLLDRALVEELAEKSTEAGVFASVAGLLGYVPVKPQADPIAKQVCVAIDPRARDAALRLVADGAMRERMAALDADIDVVDAIDALQDEDSRLPADVTLELVVRRDGRDFRGGADGAAMRVELAERICEELAGTHTPITLAGRGDPLEHEHVWRIIELAQRVGPVHVRTDLRVGESTVDRLLDAGVDVISVDLLAETPATYSALTGHDECDRVRANVERLVDGRTTPEGPDALPIPWIVPRITRCDATYEEIESFFDRWIMRAGAAVIDPLVRRLETSRIAPLALPPIYVRRAARTSLTILADGGVGESSATYAGSLSDLWSDVLSIRGVASGLVTA